MTKDADCRVVDGEIKCEVPLEVLVKSASKRKTSYDFQFNMAIGMSAGYFGWAFLWFVVGLIAYANLNLAVMLGIYAAAAVLVAMLFVIPFAGIALWILVNFFWNWNANILSALGLASDLATGTAWWIASIAGLIGGIFISLVIVFFILKRYNH